MSCYSWGSRSEQKTNVQDDTALLSTSRLFSPKSECERFGRLCVTSSKTKFVHSEGYCVNKYTSIIVIGEQDEHAVEVSLSC